MATIAAINPTACFAPPASKEGGVIEEMYALVFACSLSPSSVTAGAVLQAMIEVDEALRFFGPKDGPAD